jgi:anthranilate synthase component 1
MNHIKLGVTTPDLEQFKVYAKDRKVIPVVRKLIGDSFSPVGLYKALADERPGTFLLESAEHGQSWSRYSFVGVSSSATLRSEKGRAKWTGKPPKGVLLEGDIWNVFKQTLDFLATEPLPNLPPLTGGLVGYFAYDIVRMFERIPDDNPNETSVPDLLMLLATDFAVLDHVDGTVWLIANAVNYDGSDERVDLAYEDALQRLDSMQASLSNPQSQGNSTFNMEAKLDYSNRTKSSDYQDFVKKAINYIEAGDAFQIVLSQRFDMKTKASGLDIYRVLRSTNQSPYMYYLNVPAEDLASTEFEIIGSSPEALVTVKDRQAMMHPIAGTRARSSDSRIDDESAIELLNDPKEKAEHLMLVDLGRNDLGRVCKPGSVEVTQFMQVEKYSHVMHLVSTVIGTLNDEISAADALKATFPAGTLSGAPKVRAMEIIDELEPVRRGIYGGALGYFDFAGNMDVAITIRTALLKNGVAYVQAGAGVVADSLPSSEDMECQNKAAVVLRAVAIASSLG